MNPRTSEMPNRTMIVFRAAIRPVFGSGVASRAPVRFNPTTRATKNTTIPTIARSQPVDIGPPPLRRRDRGEPTPTILPPRSVLRRAGRCQPPDAVDEPPQELVGVGLHGYLDVRGLAPHPSPIGDGLARRQRPAQLDVDGDRLRPDERRIEGGSDGERVVDEGAVEAVVAAVELH